jgi:hypothetical protein
MINERDCELTYELVLVEEIVAMIERYSQSHDVAPDAAYLRDTMLSVAALLHIEATKREGMGRSAVLKFEPPAIGFAEAASERMNNVLAAHFSNCKH